MYYVANTLFSWFVESAASSVARSKGEPIKPVMNIFPIRLLGFGLYWAWLFLVTLSSSPVMKPIEYCGMPSEFIELLFRLAFVVAIFFLATRLSSPRGRTVLLLSCCVGGPVATVLMALSGDGFLGVAALALLGFADAATFVLWLCFFGHMRVGETALYMVLSYCLGGLLCLIVSFASGEWVTLVTVLLLAASGGMFYLSNKFYSGETGSMELFAADGGDGGEEKRSEPYPYLKRLSISLGCAAFLFGSTTGALHFGIAESIVPAALVESACCIVLAAVCGAMMFATRQSQDLCVLYIIAPTLFVVGVFLALGESVEAMTMGAALVNLGYLVFEVTALNDYCIAAKSRSLSLMRTFCSARIAITSGLVLGWAISVAVAHASVSEPRIVLFGIPLAFCIACSTIVFTERQISEARSVAAVQERIDNEQGSMVDKESRFAEDVTLFAEKHQLSSREKEIAEYILKGRNAAYIAEQLCLAPGTVKTHTHNIYTKVDVHSRMELLDAFEAMRDGAK